MSKKKNIIIDLLQNLVVNTFLTTTIVVVIVVLLFTKFAENEHELKNQALTSLVSHQLDNYFIEVSSNLNEIKEELFVQKLVLPSERRAFLENFIDFHIDISNVYVLNQEGIIIETAPYSEELLGVDHSKYEYFTKAVGDEQVVWSNIFFDYYSKVPLASVSVKVDDYVVVGIINLNEMERLLSNINIGDDAIIAIVDRTGTYFGHSDMSYVHLRERDPNFNALKAQTGHDLKVVEYEGERVKPFINNISDSNWTVIIYQSFKDLKSQIWLNLSIIIVVAMIIMILTLHFSRLKIIRINNSLADLVEGTKIVSGGEYHHALKESTYVEVEELRDNFTIMNESVKMREQKIKENEEEILKMNEYLEDQVIERTKALRDANDELYKTIEELKHAQEVLIQSEKMASLGQLVAGVTHEMMTPIGIIVTLSSHMENLIKKIDEKLGSGNLTKKDLVQFIEDQNDAVHVISSNAERTKEFVESLKKTSVDQTTMEKRVFNLCDTLTDSIRSLKVEFKHKKVEAVIKCTSDYELYSYPGGISQIVINLVQNALRHAFDSEVVENNSGMASRIVIEANLLTSFLELTIEDNGVGMSQDIANMIYEPFFTTARDSGGSGIGLSIVQNIVSNAFLGEIVCESEIGKGTKFVIRIPIDELRKPTI